VIDFRPVGLTFIQQQGGREGEKRVLKTVLTAFLARVGQEYSENSSAQSEERSRKSYGLELNKNMPPTPLYLPCTQF